MVAPVVVSVFCSKILRERGDASEARFNHLRLTQRSVSNRDHVGHLSGFRAEVILVHAHCAFGQREDDAFQIEKISHRIVVLEPIHPPNWRGGSQLAVGARVECLAEFRQ